MSFFLFSSSQRQPGWELYPIACFSDYLTAWDELNAQGPQSPLLSTDFVLPVINCFGRPNDLLAICRVETKPIAMAILGPVGIGRWSTLNPILDPLQPPVAPLGLWVTRKDTQITGILPRLLRELPGFPLVLSVMNQDSRLACRPIDVGQFNTIDHIKTPSIYMETSFSNYWKDRKKHFKHDLRRRRNNLIKSARIPNLKVLTLGNPSIWPLMGFVEWKMQGGRAGKPFLSNVTKIPKGVIARCGPTFPGMKMHEHTNIFITIGW